MCVAGWVNERAGLMIMIFRRMVPINEGGRVAK